MEIEDEEQELLITPFVPNQLSSFGEKSSSILGVTLGRAINILLNSSHKKLEYAISNIDSAPKSAAPLGASLEQSLWFLHNYVRNTLEEEASLHQVLLPMIKHLLLFRESQNSNQPLILLNWLFHDEATFQAFARSLTKIICKRDDHFISVGWCILARNLVEYETTMNNLSTNGIRDKYDALLKTLSSCIKDILSIVCSGSILQGEHELPTRLSIAAADFVLSLSIALTKKSVAADLSDKKKASSQNLQKRPVSLAPATSSQYKMSTKNKPSGFSGDIEMLKLLWVHIDELIVLVQKLMEWYFHIMLWKLADLKALSSGAGKADHCMLKEWRECISGCWRLNEIMFVPQNWQFLETGVLLLSSCWKHYGILLHLEDPRFSKKYKQLLEQYVSGIQYYSDNYKDDHEVTEDSGTETLKFFMNCISLLLGRLNVKQFETAVAEYGSQLSELLMSQLRSSDEQVVDSTILILKAVIFKTKDGSVKSSLLDSKQMDAALTMLLPLLDELDGSARAVVKLVAEYCSIYADSRCMEEVLKRLSSENVSQRKNAADVISDVINRSFETTNIPHAVWQDLANRLLLCLGDGESVIRSQASTLLPLIDPSLVLPELILLVYSQDETVELYASRTFKAVMRNHKHSPEVICTLLDCLSTLCQNSDLNATGSKGEGAKLDIDKILKLLSDWTLLVEDWNSLVDPLMDKIFSEPSNAVIVRFFSHISEYLADASHLVFNRILLYTREQKRSSKDFSGCEASVFRNDDIALFSSLCPLLIIRLLPLRVFDDLNSPAMYGQLLTRKTTFDIGYLGNDGPQSVAALLLNKMLNNSEFEDVRKLAAELCGRIHPNILVPIISHKLKDATNERDLLKIKACLFALCTSFMIRGKDSFLRKDILRIRSSIETVLSWPSTGGDDVSKAQHGCIDCVAWMVCAEVEFSIPSKTATLDTTCNSDAGDSAKKWSVCTYVIENLTQDRCPSTSEGITKSEISIHLSLRLCMANILISACQKISNSGGMKALARKAVPCIIQSVEDILDSEIKAACIQVLFSMVYHLKSEILQYSSDLLTVAMSSLRDGSHKEKLVGAKLLASLMASEEEVVGSIAGGLLEARETLASISLSDSSQDVREVCQKLLMCMTF